MNVELPLTESQERRLAITLARLEQELVELRAAPERAIPTLRLTECQDPVARDDSLEAGIAAALEQLRQLADDLCLPARREFIRQRHLARLQLALVDLYEARPDKGLAGCGPLAPATAKHLETALPQLEARVQSLLELLAGSPGTGGAGAGR